MKETDIQYPDFSFKGDFENQNLQQPEPLETFRDTCTQLCGWSAARDAQLREARGPNPSPSFAGQTTWPFAGPSLLGGRDTRCNSLEGMVWAGSSPGTVGIRQFLLFHVFMTRKEHEAQRSQLTWQEAKLELSRPSGNLDLAVSCWSKNPAVAPYYLRVMLGVSQTGDPALLPVSGGRGDWEPQVLHWQTGRNAACGAGGSVRGCDARCLWSLGTGDGLGGGRACVGAPRLLLRPVCTSVSESQFPQW